MKHRSILFASLLLMFAVSLESQRILMAADGNPKAPGPSDKDAPKEFTTTKSGLKYRILRKSYLEKPAARDTVKVQYKGWLDNGKVFDQSYGREGRPAEFPLNAVIPGWGEGLQLVGTGGMIELEIPHQLGYGEKGNEAIPPKSTLHFIVELLEVKPAPKPQEPGKVDQDAPEEFTKTESGLKYRIRRKSDGVKAKDTSTVTVHYKGWLDNGDVFDSSYERGTVATFPLNQVIDGWTEGLQLIGKGGMIELEVPYQLGYGLKGMGNRIPPKATLHFLVEVYNVR